jgi:hypothetical protein
MDFDWFFYYFFYFMTIFIGLYAVLILIEILIEEKNYFKQKRLDDERRNDKNNE